MKKQGLEVRLLKTTPYKYSELNSIFSPSCCWNLNQVKAEDP